MEADMTENKSTVTKVDMAFGVLCWVSVLVWGALALFETFRHQDYFQSSVMQMMWLIVAMLHSTRRQHV
jgi:hypothetical protein